MVVMVLAALMCAAMLAVSTSETKSAAAARQRLAALFVAEAGVERQVADIRDIQRKAYMPHAFEAIDALAGQTTHVAAWLTMDDLPVGQYTVEATVVTDAGG